MELIPTVERTKLKFSRQLSPQKILKNISLEEKEEEKSTSKSDNFSSLEEDQNKLAHKLLEAIWVEDKDIGNLKILEKICIDCNLDFENLIKKQKNMLEKFKNTAPLAAKNNIFGSPTYVINNEIFWGQDRLELFERSLKSLV